MEVYSLHIKNFVFLCEQKLTNKYFKNARYEKYFFVFKLMRTESNSKWLYSINQNKKIFKRKR